MQHSPLTPARLSPRSIRRRSTTSAVAAMILTAIALAGCAAETSAPAPTDDRSGARELLATQDLEDLDVRQIIEKLEALPLADRPADLVASVHTDALVLRDDSDREARLPLPDDEVYLSVAPFVERTHECHFHSLTTCVGELGDAEIRVTLTDADGEVLIDDVRRTSESGFAGLWVPRGIEATLTVERMGLRGTALLSTKTPGEATCITTLQLL